MKPRDLIAALLPVAAVARYSVAQGPALVFPIPREAAYEGPSLPLGSDTAVLLPEQPTIGDLFLRRLLVSELSDRYGIALRTRRVSAPHRGVPYILIGSISNPLVKQACASRGLQINAANPGPEGYVIQVDADGALVAGSDDAGAFYGLQSLRQLLERLPGVVRIHGAAIRVPGRDHIPFFKRFLADFMALYKYNRLLLEMNAGMRLDRHPELNAGWIDLAHDLNFTRRDRSTGPGEQYQNSVHQDTADGGVLEKEIEVIPEIPSLTHSYYLLTRHRELAEIPNAEWPDTYCPLNPKSYDLLFDVLDEYIEVMRPQMVQVGKKGRSVRMAIWGDHLLESVRGKAPVQKTSPAGYNYHISEALTPEQVQRQIPKDILVFNWFWNDKRQKDGWGEQNDIRLEGWGFQQAYGNFMPNIENYSRRSARRGVLGGAPSSWAVSFELSLGKDLMREFIGCANLLWSTHWPAQAELSGIVQSLMPAVHRNFRGEASPSEAGDPIASVPIEVCGKNDGANSVFDLSRLRTGKLTSGPKWFGLSTSACIAGASSALSIPVGEDATSVIFLHASAKPSGNEPADRYVYNVADTADLLGWYEVVYEDGLLVTVPIRYGVNVLEWNRSENRESRSYCYGAEQVQAGTSEKPVDLFAFEWSNPRLGKKIMKVLLKLARAFRNTAGEVAPKNPVLLKGLSIVRKRLPPAPAAPLQTSRVSKAAY